MAKYNLTLNERQAEIVIKALDLYSRIGIGQFEEVVRVYDPRFKMGPDVSEQVRHSLVSAKQYAGHPANGSYGIHNPEVDDEFRVAFDLQQVVRHRLAWDRNPKGDITVNYDKPDKIGLEDLAEIQRGS